MNKDVIWIIDEYQWYDNNGKSHRYYVKDIDDITIAVKDYCKYFGYILKENSITWDERKEFVKFEYYEIWDEAKEYHEICTLRTTPLYWIRTI